jgi:hypothetical protein
MQVNRYLADLAMDRIDHALGRPLDPLADTFRNHYAANTADAAELAESAHWREVASHNRDLRCFAVTGEGRTALAAHLRAIGDPYRLFAMTFDGYASTVVAKSRGKARYSHFLDISDVMPDLTFIDYCRRATARLA